MPSSINDLLRLRGIDTAEIGNIVRFRKKEYLLIWVQYAHCGTKLVDEAPAVISREIEINSCI